MTLECDIALLRQKFDYNEETGHLIWRARDRNLTGKQAGGVDPGHGYRRVRINKRFFLVHRVIMAMHLGRWPEHEVDHINGNRDDNRLLNLRCVPRSINLKNKAQYRSNRSGVTGVHWHAQHRKWAATISENGCNRTLGVFHRKSQAIAARRQAERDADYHPNHGRNT